MYLAPRGSLYISKPRGPAFDPRGRTLCIPVNKGANLFRKYSIGRRASSQHERTDSMRRAEGPAGALRVASNAVTRRVRTVALLVSAFGLIAVLGFARLLGVELGESASGREDDEELQRSSADERGH